MVKARREHIEEYGTRREPEGGDLNLAIDSWILVLNEKDEIKKSRKKLSKEILAVARASDIDRDNMKRSLLWFRKFLSKLAEPHIFSTFLLARFWRSNIVLLSVIIIPNLI
jgi:hypothetical protein